MTTGARDRRWRAADVGDQRGRTAVVTGANTGVGFEVARLLAEHGATVVLACRDPAKAGTAAERIMATAPGASVETLRLDLASLGSIRAAAIELRERHPRIDLLVNNAAVMYPRREVTEDGFELHFGTNHLGHFAFTGLVLAGVLPVSGSRIVTVGSSAHRAATIAFDDLVFERGFRTFEAYGRSKLANILFAYELQRRLDAVGAMTISVVGDPGATRTDILRTTKLRWGYSALLRPLTSVIVQTPANGALGVLRAAVDPDTRGGEHFGPSALFHIAGRPTRIPSSASSYDEGLQARLWQVSEELTGVTYDFGPTGPSPRPS